MKAMLSCAGNVLIHGGDMFNLRDDDWANLINAASVNSQVELVKSPLIF